VNRIIPTRPARINAVPSPQRWELALLSRLLLALRARDDRIARLEELNRQLSVALDEERRSSGRRAA
jgi:hypothetical protein